jgi:hypothetical protein
MHIKIFHSSDLHLMNPLTGFRGWFKGGVKEDLVTKPDENKNVGT